MNTPQLPSPRSEFLRGILDTLPVIIGLLPFALILGIQGGNKGMSALEMAMMTGLNFAGGSEFAAVGLWAQPLPILLIIGVTFMINIRHILMGAALTPYIKHLPMKKILPTLFFMTDESWAMSMADIRKRKEAGLPLFSLSYYAGICATLYTIWVASSALGTVIGPYLGNIDNWGFGMAFPAVFLVLLRGMWKGRPALAREPDDGNRRLPAVQRRVVRPRRSRRRFIVCLHNGRERRMISFDSILVILGMLCVTYGTRLIGFFALRNRALSKRAAKVMDAAPGCVLVSVIAPYFASDKPHELISAAITLLAACRLPMLPTVIIAVASSGLLGLLMN